ncbi:hydrogenase maturation protease [Halorhabdus sp. BNX81]|uniref:hydrogenase maturation protease n=1 Tax=Halorhabdus sp. BNX81 TaxID=2980181 RepID=UPI0023DD184C|nr:hydrogenase maturation protease [Halorhabdus sp. BNX81]WEL21040.1 Ni,Fe-hydrogenase maturation factor [Halorhabdus sp. BNX81]
MTLFDEDESDVAVVGVGNAIMGDDGVGGRVIRALQDRADELTDGVRLSDAGTTGMLALEAMSGCERAIVVDAISADGEPGSIYRYELTDGSFDGQAPPISMHDVSFCEGLSAGRNAYELPAEILVIGVEPARIELSVELSETVAERVPEIVDLILRELDREPVDESVVRA